MKSLYLPALMLFFALISIPAVSARIGETESQLIENYGRPVESIATETFGPMRGFFAGGYIVGVKFMNGVSTMEMISRADQGAMDPGEIVALLKKHGSESAWKADRIDNSDWKRWRTEDSSLVAVYNTTRHFLYVNTRSFFDQHAEQVETSPLPTPGSE